MTRLDLSTGTATNMQDYVAEEVPLKIIVNNDYAFVIWCSPMQLRELAVGHLYAENILHSIDEVQSIEADAAKNVCHVQFKPDVNLDERMEHRRRGARIVPLLKASTAAYQKDAELAVVKSELTVKAQVIFESVNQLNFKAVGFRQTGGLHVAAVYKADGSLVALAEDVGRHNAADKAIGMAALNKVPLSECFLASSGRLSGDMTFKAAKVGIPIIASIAAALSSGLDAAQKTNVTLVGFVRGRRLNIYTVPERIIV